MSSTAPFWILAIWQQLGRWTSLLRQMIFPSVFPGFQRYCRRLFLLLIGMSMFIVLQLVHMLGLLIDNLLFRNYRKVAIQRPVFILGVPRSGTTHTHQLLADDRRFTTVTLWEALFAPSITERYLYSGLAWADRQLGAPLSCLTSAIENRLNKGLDDIHPIGLTAAEEDFLLLMPTLDCFLMVLIFPECDWLWALSRGDMAVDTGKNSVLMRRYRRLLQRHLYFHGEGLQLLSKNASFSGLAHSLAREFSDALFVVCERDAEMVVRSQLRSIEAVRSALHSDQVFAEFDGRLLDTLVFYYQNLQSLQTVLPETQRVSVPLWRMSREPRSMIESIYAQLNLGSAAALNRTLERLESSNDIRPATSSVLPIGNGQLDTELVRFASWRHAPEYRF